MKKSRTESSVLDKIIECIPYYPRYTTSVELGKLFGKNSAYILSYLNSLTTEDNVVEDVVNKHIHYSRIEYEKLRGNEYYE